MLRLFPASSLPPSYSYSHNVCEQPVQGIFLPVHSTSSEWWQLCSTFPILLDSTEPSVAGILCKGWKKGWQKVPSAAENTLKICFGLVEYYQQVLFLCTLYLYCATQLPPLCPDSVCAFRESIKPERPYVNFQVPGIMWLSLVYWCCKLHSSFMASLTDVMTEVTELIFSMLCYQNNWYLSALMKSTDLQPKTIITVNFSGKMKVDVVV